MLKIYKAKKELHNSPKSPGTVETDNKTFLKFAASDGYIYVTELQLEGKKRMGVEEFLRGYRFV
jgi:methionyl-tRNA formyltransferase